jgi:peptidoglycan/LPS O-acetylase OafA/YrhL
MKQRYQALDSLRFFAAGIVMLFHYQDYLPWQVFGGYLDKAYLMVDFFFALSGFVIHQTYQNRISSIPDYLEYLARRLGRIYPLHIVTFGITAFIGFAALSLGVHIDHSGRFRASAVLPNIALLHAWGIEGWPSGPLSFNGPSWSISAEFLVYLLFAFFLLGMRRIPVVGWFALAGLAVVANIWLRHWLGLRFWTLATWDFGAFRAVPSFMAGMGVSAAMVKKESKVEDWLAYCAIFLTLVLLALGASDTLLVCVFPAVIWLTASSERCGGMKFLRKRYFVRLGEVSYGIYLLHQVVALATIEVVLKLFHPGPIVLCVVVLFAAAATIIGSLISYSYIELPITKMVGAIAERWRAGRDVVPNVTLD